jgi:hypothetical protein
MSGNDKLRSLSLSMHMMLRTDGFTCSTVVSRPFFVSFNNENNMSPSMKMTAFRDIAPCCQVEVDSRSRGTLMVKAVCISETSVYLNETTKRHIPEGCPFHTHRRENLNSLSLSYLLPLRSRMSTMLFLRQGMKTESCLYD